MPTKLRKSTAKGPRTTSSLKNDIASQYAILQARYSLPMFAEIDALFDVASVEAETKRPLKEVAKRIFEEIDLFRKTLENLMQPDNSILSMQEAEALTEAQHEIVVRLARAMMRLDRRLLRAEAANTDEEYADFIRQAATEWPAIRKELSFVAQALEQSWSRSKKSKPSQHYLG